MKLNENTIYQPLTTQYFDYLSDILVGDFGPSFRYPGRSVTELISIGLPVTFELALYSILFALAVGVVAGILGALKPNTPLDYIPMSTAMIGICIPSIILGPSLILIFGIWLEWVRFLVGAICQETNSSHSYFRYCLRSLLRKIN